MTSRRPVKHIFGWGRMAGVVVATVGLGERGKHFVWVSKCSETSCRLLLESARIFTLMPLCPEGF